MSDFKDVQGYPLYPDDRVGIAFSYSRASVGHIRLGRIVSLEPHFVVHWDKEDRDSPPMVFSETRVVKLS